MADVIHRTTLQQRFSVNTPSFPTVDWIINPDLDALSGVEKKYWKVVGDTVVEMTQGEKDALDAAALAAAKTVKIDAINKTTAFSALNSMVGFEAGVDENEFSSTYMISFRDGVIAGKTLLSQIAAAKDQAELDAIVDNRDTGSIEGKGN